MFILDNTVSGMGNTQGQGNYYTGGASLRSQLDILIKVAKTNPATCNDIKETLIVMLNEWRDRLGIPHDGKKTGVSLVREVDSLVTDSDKFNPETKKALKNIRYLIYEGVYDIPFKNKQGRLNVSGPKVEQIKSLIKTLSN